MKFTDEEYARCRKANRIHELEQRVEELEGITEMSTTTLTQTTPTEPGWYWFMPNGKIQNISGIGPAAVDRISDAVLKYRVAYPVPAEDEPEPDSQEGK